jgi:hypothetical protein
LNLFKGKGQLDETVFERINPEEEAKYSENPPQDVESIVNLSNKSGFFNAEDGTEK